MPDDPILRCKICSVPLPAGRRSYCCDACARESNKLAQRVQQKKPRPLSPVYSVRPCMDCGKLLRMHIKSKRCPECQRAADRANNLRHLRNVRSGSSRKLGSTDLCARCGQPYVVNSGLQRYCPACAPQAWRDNDRATSRAQALEKLRDPSFCAARNAARRSDYKATPRICKVCGAEFLPHAPRQKTCSEACARANRAAWYRAYYHRNKASNDKDSKT